VVESDSATIESFNLTNVAQKLLKQQKVTISDKLRRQFPQETDFINKL
jgi:hypothetical protein